MVAVHNIARVPLSRLVVTFGRVVLARFVIKMRLYQKQESFLLKKSFPCTKQVQQEHRKQYYEYACVAHAGVMYLKHMIQMQFGGSKTKLTMV